MSKGAKVFLVVVLTIFALFTTTVTFAAVAIYRQGSIGVSVHEKGPGGTNLALSVPAFLVTGAPPEVQRWGSASATLGIVRNDLEAYRVRMEQCQEWHSAGTVVLAGMERALKLAAVG